MNIENLRLFVAALREVVDTLPEAQEVNMMSISPPAWGAPGCHAGLAALALDRLGAPPKGGEYDFELEAARLAEFLGFDGKRNLTDWAYTRPDEWGGYGGGLMFAHHSAFGQDSKIFPARVIADHWAGVLERIEEKAGW